MLLTFSLLGAHPVLGGPGLHRVEGCGFKIPARPPEQVVTETAIALELLSKDNGRCERLGRGARQRAADVYDWNRMRERMGKVYTQILEAPSHEV